MNASKPLLGLALVSVTSLGYPSNRALAAEFTTKRHVYVRGEKARVEVALDAGTDAVLFDVSGRLAQTVKAQADDRKTLQSAFTFDTNVLRAGDYEVRAQPSRGGQSVGPPLSFTLTIAPAPDPQRFPVWNWGTPSTQNLSWWQERGFNGFRLGEVSEPQKTGSGASRSTRFYLDEAARHGFDVSTTLSPLRTDKFAAAGMTGARLYPRVPEVAEFGRRTADTWMKLYQDYPALKYAFFNSEFQVRLPDAKLWTPLAQQESGLKAEQLPKPEWFASARNVYLEAEKLPAALQPKGGLIDDDHSVYRFLQWWWQRGHGTSVMNAEMAKIVKGYRPDMGTWHDPYRLAPVYGSHTGLDMIGTWTYGHPDIKRLGYTTVLQAAARPERQKVMQNISLYVYGRFVTPIQSSTADLLNDQGGQDQSFMQSPDYAREATWLVMAQRPDVLTYYFAAAKSPDNTRQDPYLASPQTFDAIGEVSRTLIQPFGPTILSSTRERPKVAVLLSASALWFNGARGWVNEQILPFTTLLMMNHVPFDVVLDDDILAGRLDQYDALVIPNGEVLLRGVHGRISAFARGGKKVIAARSLVAPIPNVQKTDFDFSFMRLVDGTYIPKKTAVTAEDYRTRMEKYAAELKPLVAGLQGIATAGSPRVVTGTLQSGDVRYVFAVNDDKTYGPRFGQWKLFQELGVRQQADLQIADSTSKAFYDALERREIKVTPRNGHATFTTMLPAAGGKLIAVLPEKIGKIELTVPAQAERGRTISIRARVLGTSGKPIVGAIPLRVQVLDALGRSTEFTRYGATASDGSGLTLPITPALNDEAGNWTIRVTEYLGNQQVEQDMAVR